ncbi:hypothetical protein ANCDUO_05969 [Ancylostoma duodenale]|uniref:Uncharacterized protein n=1 Tax=Ancylostoma duodenale TaxID=51022 RepID=A0A0C2DM85_9BILA|nr:hypothetical protein ANCDUO_05969 [Ancylostoma duodenale]
MLPLDLVNTSNGYLFRRRLRQIGLSRMQILPIIERGRDCDMLDKCIKNSHLWRFLCHSLFADMQAAQSVVT